MVPFITPKVSFQANSKKNKKKKTINKTQPISIAKYNNLTAHAS